MNDLFIQDTVVLGLVHPRWASLQKYLPKPHNPPYVGKHWSGIQAEAELKHELHYCLTTAYIA